jgi:hypothetical protein
MAGVLDLNLLSISTCTQIRNDVKIKDTVLCDIYDSVNVHLPKHYVSTLINMTNLNSNLNHTQTNEYKIPNILRDSQLDAFKKAMHALIHSYSHTALLNLPTGFGKTVIAISIAFALRSIMSEVDKHKFKVGILYHRSVLVDQWINAIHMVSDSISSNTKVKVVSSSDHNIVNDDSVFYIINPTITHIHLRSEYSALTMLIVDECHALCTPSIVRKLLLFTPSYLLGLSATPKRLDAFDTALDLFYGRSSPLNLVSVCKSIEFDVRVVNTGFMPREIKTLENGKLDWSLILKQQADNEKRNNLICDIVCDLVTSRNILVMCKRKSQAVWLHNAISNKLQSQNTVVLYIGSSSQLNKAETVRVIVTTYSKGGVGMDVSHMNALVTAGDVDAAFKQAIGRIFRNHESEIKPLYICLVDKFGPLKKHALKNKNLNVTLDSC